MTLFIVYGISITFLFFWTIMNLNNIDTKRIGEAYRKNMAYHKYSFLALLGSVSMLMLILSPFLACGLLLIEIICI